MDEERFEEIFDEVDEIKNFFSDYKGLEFTEVRADNCWLGLVIIAKYMDPNENTLLCGAEHDKIWSVGIDDLCEAGITEEDVTLLAKYNWCTEDGSLMCFV